MLEQAESTRAKPVCPVGELQCKYLDRLSKIEVRVQDLESQVRTDPLTGLYNYRHFAESLDNEMERTRRTGQPTALIMIDLDHFKGVNDTWGHEVGNLVLQQTAKMILANLRKLDLGCRYGGEEFAVILPNTRLQLAMEVAERLRYLRETKLVALAGGKHFQVTASMGMAVFSGTEFFSRQDFVAQADNYLYRAKQAGRNRIMGPEVKVPAKTEVTTDEKRALLE